MTHFVRLIAFIGLLGGLFSVSCSSTAPAKKTAALPRSLSSKVPTDKACLNRVSPPPGFYRKGGSLHAVVKTTAYCHTEADSLKYGKRNAVGCDLRYDHVRSAAADWSVYPVGTLFRIAGQPYIYRIDDYGSALVGTRTIDLYQPTQAHMKAWGARMVDIEILKWGSYSKSMAILSDRSRHAHVKAMMTSMEKKRLVVKN